MKYESRKNRMFRFGFGTDIMRKLVVCPNCASLENGARDRCSKCETKLPKTNLFEFYKSQHNTCTNCGTVLSSVMDYCPHCGKIVRKN